MDTCFVNELDKLLRDRRSIRKYTSEPVPPEMLAALIHSAVQAPSPSNSQPVRFVRLVSDETRTRLQQALAGGRERFMTRLASRQDVKRVRNWIKVYYRYSAFMFDAPVLLAVGTVTQSAGFAHQLKTAGLIATDPRKDADNTITVGLALQNLMLKAASLGLGSCILTAPLVFIDNIDDVLNLSGMQVKCLLTLGFAAQQPPAPSRLTAADIYAEV